MHLPWPARALVLNLGFAAAPGAIAHAEDPADAPAPAAPDRTPPLLLEQVAPAYPDEALGQRLSGEVSVLVTVGPDGAVTDVAYASGGPEVFVPAALDAAAQLRFQPATAAGTPVAARVSATFTFAPPLPEPADGQADSGASEDELLVYGERALAETETHAVTTLSVADLDRAGGEDLGETLAAVPGVAMGRGNADGTKPIIRGQVERRLLVLFDGVRHESQKWGLDHATEIDPFAAGEIHVIKGAAGVRYGPDAIGGVVLVEPPPLRDQAGVSGRAQLVYGSNGRRGVAAAALDGSPEALPGLAWRLEGNYARGAALSTPTYVLGNTGSQAWNAGASLGWDRGDWTFEASFHHFDLEAGVCYCASSGTPEELLAQLELDAPISSELWTTTAAIDRPYQAVTHDIGLARVQRALSGGGALRVTAAFQGNLRQEYEPTRASISGPQYDFTLRTTSLDVGLTLPVRELAEGRRLEGGLGLSGAFQENVYRGLPLIPNFRGVQGGVFAYERLVSGAVELEAGARYDHLSRVAYLTPSAFERSLSRGALREQDCALTEASAACPAAYDAVSASLGGLWRALPDRLEARLDLSSATRFPSADELYMNGSAPTSPVYAIGDAGLGPETTWGASPSLGLRLPWIEAEGSPYLNRIDDYVYFAPELGSDGGPVVDVTVQGAYPRFSFRPIDATFFGIDGGLTLGPEGPVQLRLQGAVVRAVDAATGEALLGVPPDRAEATLRLAPAPRGRLSEPFVEVTVSHVARQDLVDPEADLAPPPDAYTLLDAGAGAGWTIGERTLRFGIDGKNLLNARYRDYTSLLRYYADEPGREIRLRVSLKL